MRIPLLYADFKHGSYTKIAKALRKVWPPGPLSLMQSQDTLAVLLGYNNYFDARHEASASFASPSGSISMKDVGDAVVRQMFVRFRIDPFTARALVPRLHLTELAVAGVSRESEIVQLLARMDGGGRRAVGPTGGSAELVLIDEAALVLGALADPMKERVRAVEAVPNAHYQVRGDRVFVFDKLVRLVQALGLTPDEPDFQVLVTQLVLDATERPEEAVGRWKIIPAPYEIEQLGRGRVAIRHKPFNSRVPGVYDSEADAQPALAKLLVGAVVGGEGQFVYRGQPMTLRDPLDIRGFTMKAPEPNVKGVSSGEGAPTFRAGLYRADWRPGFEPVSEELYLEARAVSGQWARACEGMERWVARAVDDVWLKAAELPLGALNDPRDIVPDGESGQVQALRDLYPELLLLSDATLWSAYDNFQLECWHMNSWEARRDDDLIYYLAGQLVDANLRGYGAIPVGTWALYQWMQGGDFTAAKEFAREVHFNSDLADSIARRVDEAMLFLTRSEKEGDLRGEEVSTFGDMFRLSRKRATLSTVVSQSIARGPTRRPRR